MAFNPKDLIRPMTFVYVNTDKFESEEVKLLKGDILFVAGQRALPLTEDDPYTQRIFIYAQPVIDDYIDTTKEIYVLDPIHLTNLDEEENERLIDLAVERANATVQ